MKGSFVLVKQRSIHFPDTVSNLTYTCLFGWAASLHLWAQGRHNGC